MNLNEALSSGKKIKRKKWDFWLKQVGSKLVPDTAMVMFEINTQDILADDWEIEKSNYATIKGTDNNIIELIGNDDLQGFSIFIEGKSIMLSEEDVESILTFIHDNSTIGNKRIIPF